jgi:hypothetical protein
MFHVLGDPTMDIWTGFPQNLDVSYELIIPSLEVTVESDGNPVEGAMVCLTQESGFYIKGMTDSTGIITLDTTQSIMGEEATLIVTKHNFLCYENNFKLNQPPETPDKPDGPKTGQPHKDYTFTTSTTDPDGDQVYYQWSWGDGSTSEWYGPYDSGETVSVTYSWNEASNYGIKVKTKDIYGAETDWSEKLWIDISKNRVFTNPLIFRILERLAHYFPILELLF